MCVVSVLLNTQLPLCAIKIILIMCDMPFIDIITTDGKNALMHLEDTHDFLSYTISEAGVYGDINGPTGLFYNCKNLTRVYFYGIVSGDCTSLFNGCIRLRTVEFKKNTSDITNMSYMFAGCISFNQVLDWDVKNVSYMNGMFMGAAIFNQPLNWDVRYLVIANHMFHGANKFDATTIECWDVNSIEQCCNMFSTSIVPSWY